MDTREKIDEALKDLSVADEEMLDVFFAFANEHLERAVQTVNDINQMLKEIKQELNTCAWGSDCSNTPKPLSLSVEHSKKLKNTSVISAVLCHTIGNGSSGWKRKWTPS